MNLNFVPTRRRPFSMEVGYFDTIQEIKEKIQKYHKIPAQKQTLIFNNQVLQDHLNIHPTEIIDKSHIQLIISEDQESTPPPENQEQPPPPSSTASSSIASIKFGSSTEKSELCDLWLLAPSPEKPTTTTTTTKLNQESSLPPPPETAVPPETAAVSKKITLILNMPSTALAGMATQLAVNDSVRRLKEKIVNQVDQEIPVGNIIVRSNGVELHDHNSLHECGLMDYSEIDISIKRSAPPTSSINATTNDNSNNSNRKIPKVPKFPSSSTMDNNCNTSKNKNPGKLKIMVVTFHGKKVAVEVNANDNVEELRKELDKVNEREALNLCKEGFFFLHKQSVMDEDQSFEVQNVREGDTIEIFNGRITKGSTHRKLPK